MKDWDFYRFMLALNQCGSIRGAAGLLGVNHATVSRRLAQINEHFGGHVFERAGGKYVLTRLGEPLIMAAEQMELVVLQAERRQKAVESGVEGPITLSLPETIAQYILNDKLIEYCHLYPNIQLIVETSYRFADLDRSEADVVIRGHDTPPDHLVGQRLFPYALSFYAHKDYLKSTQPDALSWMSFSGSGTPPSWLGDSPFPDVPVRLQAGDLTLLLKLAEAGHGMIRTACYLGDASPSLERLPDAKQMRGQDFWVLTHPDLRYAPRIRTLTRFLVDALNERKELIAGMQQNHTMPA